MGNFTFLLALLGLSASITGAAPTSTQTYTPTSIVAPPTHNFLALKNHTKTHMSFITSTITSKIQGLTSSMSNDPDRVLTITATTPKTTVTLTQDKLRREPNPTTSIVAPPAHNFAALNHTKTSMSFITSTITSKAQRLTCSTTSTNDPNRVLTSTVTTPKTTVTITSDKLRKGHPNTQISPDIPVQTDTVDYPDLVRPNTVDYPDKVRRDGAEGQKNSIIHDHFCHLKLPFTGAVPVAQYSIKLTTHQRPPDLCGGLWDNLNGHVHCLLPFAPLDCDGEEHEDGKRYITRWEFSIGVLCRPEYVEKVLRAATRGAAADVMCGYSTFA